MKTAIVYYSMSGNTEYVANCIKERVGADLIKIVPTKEYPSKGAMKFIWGGVMKMFPNCDDSWTIL